MNFVCNFFDFHGILFDRDIKCGKLFCKGGNEFPLVGTVAITLTIGNQYKCKTVGASEDQTEWLDPGLVRSGTTCGAGRVSVYYITAYHAQKSVFRF